MNYKDSKQEFLANNAYLLITAAWAITIAFIIDNYWSGTSTPQIVQKTIQRDIQKKQKDFETFCTDTSMVKKLALSQYNEATLQQVEKKEYFIYIYNSGNNITDSCVFWSTQVVQPDSLIIASHDTSYVRKLLNGWYVINKKITAGGGSNKYKIISLITVNWDYYLSNK